VQLFGRVLVPRPLLCATCRGQSCVSVGEPTSHHTTGRMFAVGCLQCSSYLFSMVFGHLFPPYTGGETRRDHFPTAQRRNP